MPTFAYDTTDEFGISSSGLITAATVEKAQRMLTRDGKFVVRINSVTSGDGQEDQPVVMRKSGSRIGRSDLIFFAGQLSVMVETGVPLADALTGIGNHTRNFALRRILEQVSEGVQSGEPLSKCLGEFPRVFPSIMTSLVAAGESSGQLGQMLERATDYLIKEQQINKQVRNGLTYPLFMLCMCTTITVFLLIFVLPKFASIYANRGAVLPGPTRFLMALSNNLTANWLPITVALGCLVSGLVLWCRTPWGRVQIDWIKLHLPIIGAASRALYLTRSTRTFATLVDTGVSLLEVIAVVQRVVPNKFYFDLWSRANEDLQAGKQLSDTLFASRLIPGPVAQMIESGEKAGRLKLVFTRVADYSEKEFDDTVKAAIRFIEPVMMLFIGGVIGFIAIALLLPIFSAGDVMSGR